VKIIPKMVREQFPKTMRPTTIEAAVIEEEIITTPIQYNLVAISLNLTMNQNLDDHHQE
jgi:hypothetical protein